MPKHEALQPSAIPYKAQPLEQLANLPAAVRTVLCYLIVLGIGLCCFVVGRASPPHLFWDENYHVTSTERYIENVAQFETHPPLGKLLIATGEWALNPNASVDKHILTTTKQISGDNLPQGFSFAGMRLMPSLFAVFGALAFFTLMRELFENRLHALLLTSLYLFENAFNVHFRAVHLDAFQMFFNIMALWQFARLWKCTTPLRPLQYATLSLWCSLAMMVKVNAAFLLIMFPILYLHDAHQQGHLSWPGRIGDFFRKSGMAVLTMCLTFFCVFYVHAMFGRKLPDPETSAGGQDIANMSPAYRTYLEQHQALTPNMVVTIAVDYFKFMQKDNKGVPKLDVTKPGENGSHPLHWPFHDRNINYRWDSADGKTSYVQLVGNQLMWYSGTAAVVFCFILVINYRLFAIPLRGSLRTYQLIEVFTGLYLVFMLLHLWLITQRVMYLYHYFIGLLISYILLALLWQYLCEVHAAFARHRTAILATACTAFFACYLFFLPLSNHWPLTKAQCERRNISISHIVDCQ